MNIIIMTSAGMASGGARQALYLAMGLRDRGHKVDFVCPDSEPMAVARQSGLNCHVLPKKLGGINRLLRSLMPSKNGSKADECAVVHAFHNRGVKAAAYLGTLWRFQGLPVACVAHRGVTSRPSNPLPYLLPGIRFFLVNSRACADVMPMLWRRDRCRLVNNAIPEERLNAGRGAVEMRTVLDIQKELFVFGAVAQDKPEKGVERLLRAYAAVRGRTPESVLIVVGVNPKLWEPLCGTLGILEHVRLVPRTHAVADYVQIFSLFVFSSYFIESQPNVIMEAMCLGVPVIGSAIGGVPELLAADCLFKPGDVGEMGEKMVEMANNRQRLKSLVEENSARARAFSMDYRLDKVLEFYRLALGEIGCAE